METPGLFLCRRTIYAPACYLCYVYTRFIFRENSRKSNLILCRGSWPWGEGIPGNHHRRTVWGMVSACVKGSCRWEGWGGREEMKEEREREKGTRVSVCTHIHSLVRLTFATSRNMLQVKIPPERDLTASRCQTIVSWLSEGVTCSQAKPKD